MIVPVDQNISLDFSRWAVLANVDDTVEWKPASDDDSEIYTEFDDIEVYILKNSNGTYSTLVYFGDYFCDLKYEHDNLPVEQLKKRAVKFVRNNYEKLQLASKIKFQK